LGNRQLFDSKSVQQLLEEFRQSGANAPFEEIVRRYAAMVFGVCLRVTGDKHDAEDATQAVFLSLALQAKTSRQITYVGPWLQKVAHRLALDVKKSKTRRKRREEKLTDQARHASGNGRISVGGGAFGGGNGHLVNPADAPGTEELKAIMMEELNQLPAKYRLPLVMHYFGGLSREEMSEQLGCNPSTLGVRVHRGKAMLGTRLAKRGIAISAVALAVVLEHVIREGAIGPIIGSATASASGLVAGNGFGVAIAASKVVQIVRSTARAVVYAKMKYAVVALLLISSAALATGSGVVQQIKNHLPSLNISEWIKPLFKGWIPSLRADAGNTELDPLDEVPATPSSREPKITIDPDHVYTLPNVVAAPPAVPHVVTGHAVARVVTAKAPEPKFNDLARAVLSPNITPAVIRPLKVERPQEVAIGTEEENDAEVTDRPLDVSADTSFTLGAGGGGGFGKPEVYVMPANASMTSSSMTIGDSGYGVFRQLGGVNRIDGALTLGAKRGSKGVYQIDGGTLLARNEIIGDQGEGTFIQTKGLNRVEQSIIIGNGGHGSFQQFGGHVIVSGGGNSDSAPVETQTAAAQPNQGLVIAMATGATGEFVLHGGFLDATPQVVGAGGRGTVTQSGGTNTTGSLVLANSSGSIGNYDQTGGTLVLTPRLNYTFNSDTANDNAVIIKVGNKGTGTFQLGDATGTGTVQEAGGHGASVVVRGAPTAAGAMRGFGKVNLTGVLVQNGQVIADGFRHDRTLDLSSFSYVTSTIENPRWAGTNGWFARRRGALKLPDIRVAAGTGTYTWGEDPGDALLDLVNSVRFKVENAKHDGDVSIALLSAIRTDIPTLPSGHHFIGVWSFDADGVGGFDKVGLEIRYDDAAAAAMDLREEILKLWRYDPSDAQWHRIMDDSFSRDTLNHIIAGTAVGDFTYFAVSAPEPSGAILTLLGVGSAWLRRRRRSR
jgi:RNA polymerase sigma factor (sigma-70 family)